MKGFSELELVITAPEAYAAALALRSRARLTLGALTQLISQSESHVLLSVPFIQSGDEVAAPIFCALQSVLRKGVSVDVVSTRSGLEAVQGRLLTQGTKGRLRLFRPQVNIEDERRIGSHAKICVSDGEHAYVGSANLTMPGLNEHFEIGLLVHGEVARQIWGFWKLLMDSELLVESSIGEGIE